ncbi:MAG TPA: winged helix DNA-binding domain-containing protein [Nitrososphaerales archaeon]|nr:winged helix DNA-binding domain-containing protein [Nitrososphaerales archaeon]
MQTGSREPETLRALNRRLMHMQYLSRVASGPHSPVTAAEATCGVNSQDFGESFLSFWARVERFADSSLHSELRPKGGLVRTWTVRGTMHIFPSKDYHVHVFGSPRKRILLRYDNAARRRGIPLGDARVHSLYLPLLDDIKGRAVTSAYIADFISNRLTRMGLKGRRRMVRGWSSRPTIGPSWVGVTEMSYLGLLVNAGRKGSESLWMRTADWLSAGRGVPEPETCVVELVRKFIRNYGPVSRADILYWSYLLSREVGASISTLKRDLVEERVEGSKETYYSLEGAPKDACEPQGATVLPEFDSLMMGYRDKSRFLPPDKTKQVFRPLGMVSPTVLIDGFVAATWRKKRERNRMTVSVLPLRELAARERRSIEERFSQLGDYLGTSLEAKVSA